MAWLKTINANMGKWFGLFGSSLPCYSQDVNRTGKNTLLLGHDKKPVLSQFFEALTKRNTAAVSMKVDSRSNGDLESFIHPVPLRICL